MRTLTWVFTTFVFAGLLQLCSGQSKQQTYEAARAIAAKAQNLGSPDRDTPRPLAVRGNTWTQHFQLGWVYWSPARGAHIISGQLLETWLSYGGDQGVLSFPLGDELACSQPHAGGRYQVFEGGRIFLSEPSHRSITFRNPTNFGDAGDCSSSGQATDAPLTAQPYPTQSPIKLAPATSIGGISRRLIHSAKTRQPVAVTGATVAFPILPWVSITPIADVSPTPFTFSSPDPIRRSAAGKLISLTAANDGLRLYAGSYSGVWRSDDGGRTWFQQTRPQPAPAEDKAAGGLWAPDVRYIVVSPANRDLVLAAADGDFRVASENKTGIYRSQNGGRSWRLVHQFSCPWGFSVGEIAFAPDDPQLIYAAGGCGVALSRDAGNTWIDKTLVDDDGSVGEVYKVAVAPESHVAPPPGTPSPTTVFRRIYAVGQREVWYSEDDGEHWARDRGLLPFPISDIAIEPTHQDHLYLGVADLANGPSYYQTPNEFGPDGVFCNDIKFAATDQRAWSSATWRSGDPVIQDLNHDSIFDAGDRIIGGNAPTLGTGLSSPGFQIKFVDSNSDHVWTAGESLVVDLNQNYKFDSGEPVVGGPSPSLGAVLLAPRPCGEASVWLGDFGNFNASHGAGWTQMLGPPTYYGVTTPSGRVFLQTKPFPGSYLLFLSDGSHVHVSQGRPASNSWHRIEGKDVSVTKLENNLRNQPFVHVDPWALATTPGFEIQLVDPPATIPAPYRANKIATPIAFPPGSSGGSIWMSNDGGIYYRRGIDRESDWSLAEGLSTLKSAYITGAAFRGRAPSLYMGTADNDSFFSLDGGQHWGATATGCGDCGAWFVDPAQPNRALGFTFRNGASAFQLFTTSELNYVDASRPAVNIPCPPNAGVDCASLDISPFDGYRPLVLTLPNEPPISGGDYVIFGPRADGSRGLLRTQNATSIQAPQDWFGVNATAVGPAFPRCTFPPVAIVTLRATDCIHIVQASGGHSNTVFYVADEGPTSGLWKWSSGDSGRWQRLVPGDGAHRANRFFVSPYDPNIVYIVDCDTSCEGIKRSDNGGQSWVLDASLDRALTEGHTFAYGGTGASSILKDLVFDRSNPSRRFAVADSGVFFTVDGLSWTRLLSTSAIPGHPIGAFLDSITDPNSWSLYVAYDGRGLLRIDPPQPTLHATVSFTSVKVFRANVPTSTPARVSFDFVADDQLLNVGPVDLLIGAPFTLPRETQVTTDVHPGEQLDVQVAADDEANPSDNLTRPLSKPPQLPSTGMVFGGSFGQLASFGEGIHPTQRSVTFRGEFFEVTFTITLTGLTAIPNPSDR
jgi:hypothetical protein